MAIFGRKEKKLREDVKSKKNYQTKFLSRIKKRDRNTPSYAEWTTAGTVRKASMEAGMDRKKWNK